VTAAGRMRHVIQIQVLTHVRDTGGGDAPTWATITDGERWAEFKPVTSRERFASMQVQDEVLYEAKTRYLAGVTTKHRLLLKDDTRVFDIIGVVNWAERNVELSLVCVERKAVD
jgi:SPP1 family predicted phage head-tail adaptor